MEKETVIDIDLTIEEVSYPLKNKRNESHTKIVSKNNRNNDISVSPFGFRSQVSIREVQFRKTILNQLYLEVNKDVYA